MNNKPTVVVPSDPKKIDELIFALEYQIQNDVNEKDREIHKAALEKLKAAIEKARRKGGLFLFQYHATKGKCTYTPFRCVRKKSGRRT